MRGTVAKRLRRKTYGKGTHPGITTYRWAIPHAAKVSSKKWVKKALAAGAGICLMADDARHAYKRAKLEYKQAVRR